MDAVRLLLLQSKENKGWNHTVTIPKKLSGPKLIRTSGLGATWRAEETASASLICVAEKIPAAGWLSFTIAPEGLMNVSV